MARAEKEDSESARDAELTLLSLRYAETIEKN
jgi:hypothetical protein